MLEENGNGRIDAVACGRERREQITILDCPVVPAELELTDVEAIAQSPEGIVKNWRGFRDGADRCFDLFPCQIQTANLNDVRPLLSTPLRHQNAGPRANTRFCFGRETLQLNRDQFGGVLEKPTFLDSERPITL